MPAKPKHPFPVEPLTPGEVARLLRQCSTTAPTGIRNRALITVMFRAGLRVNEALKLKVPDIDPDRCLIRVLHGKGDRARVMGIDDGGMAIVQRWIDTRARLGFHRGPLFCTIGGPHPGGPMADAYVRKTMTRIGKAAGIEKRVHAHGLRHSHAVKLRQDGTDVELIRKQLGHKHLSTTQTYLDHIAPEELIAMGRTRNWEPEQT